MVVINRLQTVATVRIGIHHVALYRTGPRNRRVHGWKDDTIHKGWPG